MSMGETKLFSSFLLLATTMAVVVLFVGSSPVEAIEVCGQDVGELVLKCNNYVKKDGPKTAPSRECCSDVEKLDIECVCKNLPPGVEDFISMEKTVFVARSCGKNVPVGFKCGSFVVPPARRL